ncbi:hypothetical protein [Sandaracinobacteroides hominis]|uniref:hypothetical protein n=1 Tax=Sandaracinobacteroides hominis TaxID=2780086 RepID=UPI0018F77791|nr:hypothetical protein [Sandaracinobacteroides hominis]
MALLAAALVTTALASLSHSLFVQSALAELGTELPFGIRLKTIFRDFFGLFPTLGPVMLGSLLIAFLVAAVLKRRAGMLAPFAYALAGWAAVFLALFTMRLVYGFSPLAGARTGMGMFVMTLSGLIGGFVFQWLTRKTRA